MPTQPAQPANQFLLRIALGQPCGRHLFDSAGVEDAFQTKDLPAAISPPRRQHHASESLLGRDQRFGHIAVIVHENVDAEDGGDGLGMQVIFEGPLARQNGMTIRPIVDCVDRRLTAFGLRRGFTVVEMEFETAEGRESMRPVSQIPAADGQDDKGALHHVLSQIRDGTIRVVEHPRQSCQELQIENAFDDQQHGAMMAVGSRETSTQRHRTE